MNPLIVEFLLLRYKKAPFFAGLFLLFKIVIHLLHIIVLFQHIHQFQHIV